MSQWIKLNETEQGEQPIYLNLSQARSIRAWGGGSQIAFGEHSGNPELGRILVKESPDDIFRILRELHTPDKS